MTEDTRVWQLNMAFEGGQGTLAEILAEALNVVNQHTDAVAVYYVHLTPKETAVQTEDSVRPQ